MKKIITFFLLLGFVVLNNPQVVFGQNVNVTGAIVGNGTYPDLGSAFTAINGGAQTGANIIVSVVGNTTEPATATLNQGTWTTLSILPAGGAARSITGNIAGPLVDFNGADRVGVNGLNTGGNSLTFNNSNNTTASTLRFINDSRSVIVQNSTILGAGSSATLGTILISTSAGGGGNDSIAFNTCMIDASGANFPTNAVYSLGTTTAGQENSNIGFNACSMANYFSATLISRGIFADVGNTDWIVQGCRFYQAAARTYTTANTHRAIQISSGNNHAITGNTIGYATVAGTGTYTMTSTVATRFIGIDLGVGTTTASSVQGNTISSISLNTSSGAATANGVLCGINITAGNVNVGNVAPNIIGATTGINSLVAVPTTAGGVVVGINASSTGTVLIQNNQIGAIACSGVTAAVSGGVFGINVSGVATSITISGNTIGNATTDNIRGGTSGLTTGSSPVAGINLPSTPTLAIISNNTIQNLTSYGSGAGTGAYVRGIATTTATSATATFTISGNTVNNLSTNSTLVGMSSGLGSAVGIHHLSAVGTNIFGNTVSNIANTNTGTGAYHVIGISLAGAAVTTTLGTTAYNNRIFNLSNAGTSATVTAPAVVAGISIRSGNAATTVYNNMISLGTGQTTNTAFIGIYGNHGSTPDPTVDRIYHNTIHITGTAAAGAQPSFGVYRGDFSATTRTVPMDIRNNIITNSRTGGTGQHFAIANNYGATVSTTGWGANASNNNVLNANAATVGFWGAAQTFAGWQTASASDASSLSGVTVTYVNPSFDLHLNMGGTPTPIESGGQNLASVLTDFDGQNRPGPAGSVNGGALAPDMGADEFDGVYQDLVPPNITYTPLTFTCDSLDRTFTATITDLSGVPTTGALRPRVWFKKNAGGWVSTQGVLTAGTDTNGTWTFTIQSSLMGPGFATGTVVSYYVIAQDVAAVPNISAKPGLGLVATNVNTVTTHPTNPNTYSINAVLSGTYTVGVSGFFPTLTAAVNSYNTSCIAGPVIFSLTDATYPAETFPITLLANSYANSTNTLTIKPATGVISTISGSSATYLLGMSGADYITVNGSNGNVVNNLCPETTASRDLTFNNTNTGTASAVISLQTAAGGNGATNNKVMNCNLIGNSSTSTLVGVNISGTAIGSVAGANGNSRNSIINNSIQKVQYGIFSGGGSISTKNLGNVYDLNDLNSTAANAIGLNGITILFEDSALIRSNNIGNISFAGTGDVIGISIGSTNAANTLTAGAEVTNSTIANNTITNLVQTGTFSAVGINIAATSTGTNQVRNNMISGVFCNGTSPDFACGIYNGGGATQIYYNTVRINGATLTGADQPNMAIGINGAATTTDIKNNILVCTGSNGYNGNTGIGLSYTGTTGNYVNLISNYNDIFVSGTTSSVGRTGGLGPAGVQRITLADWQTETGRDLNSVNINPTFVSGTDVHLVAGSNPGIENAGTPIVTITNDIDCDSRTLTPDLGADEVCFQPTLPTVSASPNPICLGDTTAITIVTGSLNDASNWQWYSGSCGGTAVSTNDTIWVNPAISTDYFVRAEGGCISPGACQMISITVNSLPTVAYTVTPNDTVCIGDNLTLTGTGANTYTWTGGISNATPFIPGGSGSYTVTGTDLLGCSNTAVAAIVANPLPAVSFTVAPNDTVCTGTSVTLSGTGATSYSWTGGITDAVAFTPSGSLTYTVTGTLNGCTNTASAPIVVNTLPIVSYTVSPNDTVCAGGSITLTGNGAATYTWTGGITNATPFAPGGTLTYTVTGTAANGCSNTASAPIVVNPLPTVSYTVAPNDTVCPGGSVTLSGTGTGSYTWTGGITNAVSFTPATSLTYTVTGTDGNGCTNTASAPIVVGTVPVVNLGPDVIQPNPPAVLDAGAGFSSYLWNTTANTQTISVTTNGQYIVTVTNIFGCTDSDTINVNFTSGVVNTNGTATLFGLYPNPTTNGVFNVSIQNIETTNLVMEVLDINGRIVHNRIIGSVSGNHNEPFSLTDLSMGTYIMRITANGTSTQLRFIINK